MVFVRWKKFETLCIKEFLITKKDIAQTSGASDLSIAFPFSENTPFPIVFWLVSKLVVDPLVSAPPVATARRFRKRKSGSRSPERSLGYFLLFWKNIYSQSKREENGRWKRVSLHWTRPTSGAAVEGHVSILLLRFPVWSLEKGTKGCKTRTQKDQERNTTGDCNGNSQCNHRRHNIEIWALPHCTRKAHFACSFYRLVVRLDSSRLVMLMKTKCREMICS